MGWLLFCPVTAPLTIILSHWRRHKEAMAEANSGAGVLFYIMEQVVQCHLRHDAAHALSQGLKEKLLRPV